MSSPETRDFTDPAEIVENEARVAQAMQVLGYDYVSGGGRTPAAEGGPLTGEVFAVYKGTDKAGNQIELTIRKQPPQN
ncbi:MAG: hypothetical protein A3B10_03615 [Candidatus Doudnabacteria bacterium RIFCSPLOWO2_01_FULL_44_21]|uniref:Uncharacterized protein n=1 Tax=Candidatus Doudnabacteria bacterium RIFCSPLOWO2_01_FULL_44_21 TaxID=1817841 RepID=A0A1F5PY37_9BACT|nr:MAG: hypothetical protein A3B95_02230 [Candidatus Doudnabacteria bacterium RIFCSPHIGHO2_02_FULL_43_13b]OGE94851.1 MAG: hypothetical protein A3B10_03615 [Candidatus Doudnabacteria bacterium RIFCSPLOWO2_01_FULL_44_21]